jgi:intein/homing endonuclease
MADGTLRPIEDVQLTEKHPLRANGVWMEAGELKVGDVILRSDETLEIVRSIDIVEREEAVFNIEVEKTHTYVAGGLVVHNKPPAP